VPQTSEKKVSEDWRKSRSNDEREERFKADLSGFLSVLRAFVVRTLDADRIRKRRLVAIWAGAADRKQFSHKPVL
jgi:hypothetical protein